MLFLLLPKAKILTTAGTMLVSLAAYAWLFGWWFGLGFVLLLFVHEMGHAIQLRREGVKAGWPIFIPLLGAYIGMKEMPKDAGAEARVGLAGPVLGTIGCLVPLALYAVTGSDILPGARVHRLLPEPVQPGADPAARRRARHGRRFARLLGRGLRADGGGGDPLPQPDHPHHRAAGRPGDLAALQDAQVARDAGLPQGSRGTRLAVGAVYISLALLLAVGIHFTHFARTFS